MKQHGFDMFLCTIFILSLASINNESASSVLRSPCSSPCLLISTYHAIVAVDYDNKSMFTVISNFPVGEAIDIHYNLGYIFWAETFYIKRSNMDGTNITVIQNDTRCQDLAVEWNSLQLYWTDFYNNSILVSDLDGNNRKIIHSTLHPRGIVVDPQQGLMFWTAEDKIERSTLNRTQRVVIVNTARGGCTNSITLDKQYKLVFWLDDCNETIASSDYDGNNRKLLSQVIGTGSAYRVVFTSSLLLVGGYMESSIYKVNASSGTVVSSLQLPSYGYPGIAAYDCTLQPPVITCPRLPSPSNGTILNCLGNPTICVGSVCQFACNAGYVGSGSRTRRCHPNGTWSGQEFVCQTISCSALPLPPNSRRVGCAGNATEFYDTVCQFGCNDGYVGSGSQVRRCQKNGTWSGQDFFCEIINCTSLAIDRGGTMRMSNCSNHFGEKCNFSCPIGYRLNGSSELTCVAPGNKHPGAWNNSPPTCEAMTCPGLSYPTNGTRVGCSGNATEFFATVCQFGCYNGYIGSGSESRRCQQNGTWSGQEFVCSIINCTSLTIDSGDPLRMGNCGYHYGVKCNFSCPIGYRLNGSSELTCVAPGNKHPGVWNNSLPTCEVITCLGLSSPINGTRIGCSGNESEHYDTVCKFTCNNGFIGSGSRFRKCQQNGTWSGQEFSCEIINCTSLNIDPRGPLSMDYCGNQHGTKCSFSCPTGYRLNGSSVITCVAPGNQHPGVWNDSVPTCEAVMCPVPMPPANSVRHGCTGNATEYPYSTECQFSCIEGYTPNGSSLRKCQDNGLWSGGGEFYCEKILCESLQLPPSMRTNGSCSPLPGNACQFSCERGFNLIGSAVRWCDKDGSWTGMQPRCEVVACPMLSLPINGVLLGCNTNTTEMLYGSECRFSCEDGYVATGSTVRRCTEKATWTGTDLECTELRLPCNTPCLLVADTDRIFALIHAGLVSALKRNNQRPQIWRL